MSGEKYLLYPDMGSAQARSRQQALAQGCSGTTTYWWRCEEDGKGGAVLVIELDRPDFNASLKGEGLSLEEQKKLTDVKTEKI